MLNEHVGPTVVSKGPVTTQHAALSLVSQNRPGECLQAVFDRVLYDWSDGPSSSTRESYLVVAMHKPGA